MRRAATALLLLALASVPATTAPAPLPRRDHVRESPSRVRERRLAERKARLDAMGVVWRVEKRVGGRLCVVFDYAAPDRGVMRKSVWEYDLYDALGVVIDSVERFRDGPP